MTALRHTEPPTPPPAPAGGMDLRFDEIATLKPLDSVSGERRRVDPSEVPRAVDGDGLGLNWEFIRGADDVPLAVQLRALTELLAALAKYHPSGHRSPAARSVGAVCPGNLLFREDGTAMLLVQSDECSPQPEVYRAPECLAQTPNAAADVYAVGVMLLEALAGRPLSCGELGEIELSSLRSHPLWAGHVGDPLLTLALRATALVPKHRCSDARSMGAELVQRSEGRMARRQDLASLVDSILTAQGERATPVLSERKPPPPHPPSRAALPAVVPSLAELASRVTAIEVKDGIVADAVSVLPLDDDLLDAAEFIDAQIIEEPPLLNSQRPAMLDVPSSKAMVVVDTAGGTSASVATGQAGHRLLQRPSQRSRKLLMYRVISGVVVVGLLSLLLLNLRDDAATPLAELTPERVSAPEQARQEQPGPSVQQAAAAAPLTSSTDEVAPAEAVSLEAETVADDSPHEPGEPQLAEPNNAQVPSSKASKAPSKKTSGAGEDKPALRHFDPEGI